MNPLVRFGAPLALLSVALAAGIAQAQAPTTSSARTALGPVDTYFVTQTSLGTPFQVDSGRLAVAKGGTQDIRAYADLMVSSHLAVNDALVTVLERKAPVPPPTLLEAAYATTMSTLEDEAGRTFDRDYVRGQINYQHANADLYRYEIDHGSDPDLKQFAQQTLPKIQDHLEMAVRLGAGLTDAAPLP
jgi:putative membrane protein